MDLRELIDAVRRHIRIVIAAVVAAALIAGLYVFTRNETRPADKFRAVANLQIPAQAADRKQPQPAVVAPTNMPPKLLRNPTAVALSGGVREQTLSESGIPRNDASVILGAALSDTGDIVTLTVTSAQADATNKLIGNYVQAFQDARRAVSKQSIEGGQQGLQEELTRLQSSRNAVESQLSQRIGLLPPIVNDPNLTSATEEPAAGEPAREQGQQKAIPIIPPGTDSDTTLLLCERNALANRITQVQLAIADASVNSSAPSSFSEVLDQGTAGLVPGKVQSPIVPVGMIMLGGLALGLAAAVLIDRRDHTIRSVRVASSTLSAPLLATTPPPRRGKPEYAVLEQPGSARSAAFRIATDRLPRAIMVSTPEGDAHDDVAANLAAALADLGLQVALVATSPRQSWYLERFTVPVEGAGDVSELLEQAQEGRFNGEAKRHLAWTDLTANLVVVPPSPEGALTVPLDGIPPFLDALSRSGIDVTVIAGPPLLEEADATLVAWETQSVLWAVQVGTVTRRAASEAAARLELANVKPFGVVMVGAPEA